MRYAGDDCIDIEGDRGKILLIMHPEAQLNAPLKCPFKTRRRRFFYGIGILGVLLVFSLITGPVVIRCNKDVTSVEAHSNLRQIGLALYEFQQEYGKMPDFDTPAAVRASTGSVLPMGKKSSNDFFRQLFAADIYQSEQIFYARMPGSRKPDSEITGAKALEKGECGFTYLLGAVMYGKPMRPVVVTSMIPGTDRFDPKPFKGKAFVLWADNSVQRYVIDKQGHVIFEGKNLMDPAHPVWEGKPPAIAWPDL